MNVFVEILILSWVFSEKIFQIDGTNLELWLARSEMTLLIINFVSISDAAGEAFSSG